MRRVMRRVVPDSQRGAAPRLIWLEPGDAPELFVPTRRGIRAGRRRKKYWRRTVKMNSDVLQQLRTIHGLLEPGFWHREFSLNPPPRADLPAGELASALRDDDEPESEQDEQPDDDDASQSDAEFKGDGKDAKSSTKSRNERKRLTSRKAGGASQRQQKTASTKGGTARPKRSAAGKGKKRKRAQEESSDDEASDATPEESESGDERMPQARSSSSRPARSSSSASMPPPAPSPARARDKRLPAAALRASIPTGGDCSRAAGLQQLGCLPCLSRRCWQDVARGGEVGGV